MQVNNVTCCKFPRRAIYEYKIPFLGSFSSVFNLLSIITLFTVYCTMALISTLLFILAPAIVRTFPLDLGYETFFSDNPGDGEFLMSSTMVPEEKSVSPDSFGQPLSITREQRWLHESHVYQISQVSQILILLSSHTKTRLISILSRNPIPIQSTTISLMAI